MKRLLISSVALLGAWGCAPSDPGAVAPGSADADAPADAFGALYASAFDAMQDRIDAAIGSDIDVPVPVDAGGGYTHEQHKRNAKAVFESGLLYEATGDVRYRDHAVRLMDAYASLYPTLGLHPKQKEQTPGRLFWQSLNEAWWLVHVAQGYALFRDDLDAQTRGRLEGNLLHPMVEFLSDGQPQTFDKIHNHGTWATAAVGLTGYALDEPDYVEKALLGLDRSGTGGFLRQLDVLFSPDGYYNEGPYYQRYALMPFVLFAQAIQEAEPERGIFDVRDGILRKAIYATIDQNYGGLFFPINDAIKDKDIATTELLHGVAIAYELTGDPTLLSIAEAQNRVMPTAAGRAVSAAIARGEAQPYDYRSQRLRDGADGTMGALDVLRESPDPNALVAVVKNTSMGLGHGHFDKLAVLVFDRGHEILRDYGAARFLNIEAKYGGHYLRENNAYAKQTIAHNALVVDRQSHFDGDWRYGNDFAPALGEFQAGDRLSATSASIDTAYEGVTLTRHVALVRDPALEAPVLVDLMRADSDTPRNFDLPFHYNGQLIETNYEIEADAVSRAPLGDDHGYPYLWKVGAAELTDALAQTTILLDRRFYTMTSSVPPGTEVILAELGANDPDFNLRREPALILRGPSAPGFVAATVFEPHGEYNPTEEYTLGSRSQVARVEHASSRTADAVRIELTSGEVIRVGLSGAPDADARHSVTLSGEPFEWTGPYALSGTQR
ncbi:MAG: heparinase II/III family protein [Litorimonas sp.]